MIGAFLLGPDNIFSAFSEERLFLLPSQWLSFFVYKRFIRKTNLQARYYKSTNRYAIKYNMPMSKDISQLSHVVFMHSVISV